MAERHSKSVPIPSTSGLKDTAVDMPGSSPAGPGSPVPTAFDVWLERGLHKLFDDVTQEPIPEELLKIIEQDRDKS